MLIIISLHHCLYYQSSIDYRLEIRNEKISNIPQNFFQEMQSLKELRLDNDEIASLDGDAFHNLDDSLE